mmetsp:Transcript_26888/g.52666  ORF Transcript_26888/g.52666 Transcript_26888/m.52666 type:complete len:456 (+) Transcript_26888:89-1456(+)
MDFLWRQLQSGANLEGGRSPWQQLQEDASALWSFGGSSPSTAGPTATTTTTGSLTDSLDVSPLNELFEDPWGFDALAKEAQEAQEKRESQKSVKAPPPPSVADLDAKNEARQDALTSQLSECLLRLEVNSVEVTEMPYAVYFQILVDHLGSGRSHTVMKTHLDLAGLQAELCEELPFVRLPQLPYPSASLPLASSSFRLSLGEYLLTICSRRILARAQAVRHFFQLTDDYLRTPRLTPGTPRTPTTRTPRPAATPRRGTSPSKTELIVPTILESPERQKADEDTRRAQKERPDHDTMLQVKMQSLMRPLSRPSDGKPGPSCSDLREGQGHSPMSPSSASGSCKFEPTRYVPAQPVSSPLLATRPSSTSTLLLADTPSPTPCKTHGVLAHYPDEPVADHEERRRRHTYCVICWGGLTEIAIDPCGHLCLCATCADAVDLCPVCRGPVGKLLKVFIS